MLTKVCLNVSYFSLFTYFYLQVFMYIQSEFLRNCIIVRINLVYPFAMRFVFVVYLYILIARVQKFYILAKLVLNKIIIFLSVQRTLLLRLNYPEGILCIRSFFNLVNHCCFLTFVTKAEFWLQENIFILSNIKLTKRWILRTQVYIHHLV